MYNEKMYELGSCRSAIRELFEYGKRRAEEVGDEFVYDFSLGNPSVPAPEDINIAITDLLKEKDSFVHGYTSAQGAIGARKAISSFLNRKYGAEIGPDNIYITTGAAAGLCIVIRALNKDNDDFLVLAPYFPEYKVFIESQGGIFKVVQCQREDLRVDLSHLESTISENTKALIINSPNNPSGIVYTHDEIVKISKILSTKSIEYGKPIYLISDEPYRELVYDDCKLPFISNYYKNTIICYSYSKSLSLPGERIGYIAVPPVAQNSEQIYAAICGAGRALGYVCAPSLFQYAIEKCIDVKTDIETYNKNRTLLYESLIDIGYECIKPEGAFYLLVRTLEEDAVAFCNNAKEKGILIVPGDSFGAPGYARIAYCVDFEMIKRSIPVFKELYEDYYRKVKV